MIPINFGAPHPRRRAPTTAPRQGAINRVRAVRLEYARGRRPSPQRAACVRRTTTEATLRRVRGTTTWVGRGPEGEGSSADEQQERQHAAVAAAQAQQDERGDQRLADARVEIGRHVAPVVVVVAARVVVVVVVVMVVVVAESSRCRDATPARWRGAPPPSRDGRAIADGPMKNCRVHRRTSPISTQIVGRRGRDAAGRARGSDKRTRRFDARGGSTCRRGGGVRSRPRPPRRPPPPSPRPRPRARRQARRLRPRRRPRAGAADGDVERGQRAHGVLEELDRHREGPARHVDHGRVAAEVALSGAASTVADIRSTISASAPSFNRRRNLWEIHQ